jgi:hypothetical protein
VTAETPERIQAERDWLAAALRRLASDEWFGTQGYGEDEIQRRTDFARDKLAAVAPLPFPGEAGAASGLAATGQWTVTELAAALDRFYGWFTVVGGGARVQGQLLGADAEEFARVLRAGLESARAHRE